MKDISAILYLERFIPAETGECFGPDVLLDYSIIPLVFWTASEMWVPAYYPDVLASMERDTLVEYQPGLADLNSDVWTELDGLKKWYHYGGTDINNGRTLFFNAAVCFGIGNGFYIREIRKTWYGYDVLCVSPSRDNHEYGMQFNWSLVKPLDFNTRFLLYLDGDYIDIYVNDFDHLFGTLVHVKNEFIVQYQNLMHTNQCNLDNVEWPRRADGSTNWPPPYRLPGFAATHRTTDNLRLREAPITSDNIVTVLKKGAAVEVLETGETETIDGMTAPWVKVRNSGGNAGWCFSGYLEPVANIGEAGDPKPPQESPEIEAADIPEPDTKKSAGPLPIAAVAGVAVIAALLIFAVRRRKKRR